MNCYQCNATLTAADHCPECGADVRKYKKIQYAANHFYNEGLARAQVRDLSGAVVSLRQSLRLNKMQIDARNLLGLVYFEMGETVAALSEWVISSNLQPDDNPAPEYVKRVQSSPKQLDMLRAAIRKYNSALAQAQMELRNPGEKGRGGEDVAVIGLRRALQYNPKYLRARQLLALLYLKNGEFRKAKRELEKLEQADAGNTTTLRYRRYLERQMTPDDTEEKDPRIISYTDGNETIIQPANSQLPYREGSPLLSTLLNMVIGLVIGAAVVGFFIMPARVQTVRMEAAEEVRALGEQLDNKTQQIAALESEKSAAEAESAELARQLEEYAGNGERLGNGDILFEAAARYITDPEDVEGLAQSLEGLSDTQEGSAQFLQLRDLLLSKAGAALAEQIHQQAVDLRTAGDIEGAVARYEEALTALEEGSSLRGRYSYDLADALLEQYRAADGASREGMAVYLERAVDLLEQVLEMSDIDETLMSDATATLQEARSLTAN